ncbi:MAG: NAD(P)/FAD-dependent oxidoreductase [Anaerolineae bacterium]|nr:NAD(P)/FAD-dependent oxidoreductase [Anaerolineae bacterium]
MVVGDVATAVDVIVLGAGPAGYTAAIRAAQLGQDVVIIDPKSGGGSCLNEGCHPADHLLAEARRHQVVNWGALQRRKREIIDAHRQQIERQLERHGVAVAQGKGWFINATEMRVEGQYGALKFIFDQAVIATGGKPTALNTLPFDGEQILTPTQALALEHLPSSIAIIGADYIAAELATLFITLGVPTQLLIPAGHRLLAEFDAVAGQLVETQLKQNGVAIKHDVTISQGFAVKTDKVIVSVGIEPNTAGLHLEAAGVAIDACGFIPVNDRMQTNIPAIYAAGDVTGGPPLAALAIKQGRIAAEAIAGRPVQYAPQALPMAARTDPEIAAVGLTAVQAEALGYDVVSTQLPINAGSYPPLFDASHGFALIVAEKESQLLLGLTLVCPHAGDIISEAALAIELGATLTDLAETIHPYPSLSQVIQHVAEAALETLNHGWP